MRRLLKATEWINASPEYPEVVFTNPQITREELKRMVGGVRKLLAKSPAHRIALSFKHASTFTASLLAVFSLGKIPVLFNCNKRTLKNFEHEFDVLLTDEPLCVDVPLIYWDGLEDYEIKELWIDKDSAFVLFTSGSTGRPQKILKTIETMDKEIEMSAFLFQGLEEDISLHSTVSFYHLFGLTYSLWMPLSHGIPISNELARFPENVAGLSGKWILITSPTFLRNLDLSLPKTNVKFVLSSGGAIFDQDLENAFEWLNSKIYEIYGSTETGAIGWRKHTENKRFPPWSCMPKIEIYKNLETGCVTISSPLVNADFRLNDLIDCKGVNQFILKGRSDRIAKIGEKRCSLIEIENSLAKVTGIQCAVLPIERGKRTVIGAVLITEKAILKTQIKSWKQKLENFLEPYAIPRLWRRVKSLPHNSQSKIDWIHLAELFDERVD